ncbi:MAG: DUF4276 family protein [Saprospiraceae bacterium]|jgi:hypothetical protein|nr:DUF4276 family protein [Saprospiraceae bacterium]
MRLEILVEEASMKTFLEGIFDKIIPTVKWKLNENVFIRAFEGKSHLQKEIPKKAKAYKHFHERVKMVVIHDQDSSNCKELKTKIENLISPTQFQDYKIRIVCKELENWYFGDIDALEKVIPGLKGKNLKNKAKFRNPEIPNGKDEIKKIKPDYGAIEFATEISQFINICKNRAASFNQTIDALQNILMDEGN